MSLIVKCLILYLLITPPEISTTNSNKDDLILRNMVNALYGLLDCVGNYKLIDINLAFGLVLTAGQLQVIINFLDPISSPSLYNDLNELRGICLNVLSAANEHLKSSEMFGMLEPSLWEIDKPSKNILISSDKEIEDLKMTVTQSDIKSNDLSPQLSNECIKELLNGCKLNAKCLIAENADCSSYELTHQILFWQTFRQLNCVNNADKVIIDKIIQRKCTKVFEEIRLNYQNIKENFSLDLLLEQDVVCGLENYEQFLSSAFKNIVLSNQSNTGCYDDEIKNRNGSTASIEFERNHIHGVAAATLVIQIKDLILNQ